MIEPATFLLAIGIILGVLVLLPRVVRWWAAQRRAAALLREVLGEAAYRQLDQHGYLEVRSPSRPSQRYRIPRQKGLVTVYDGDKLIMSLCVQPTVRIPGDDTVLMHKLLIEGNEAEYLRIANRRDLTLAAPKRHGK
jgi:hypothetical protein